MNEAKYERPTDDVIRETIAIGGELLTRDLDDRNRYRIEGGISALLWALGEAPEVEARRLKLLAADTPALVGAPL